MAELRRLLIAPDRLQHKTDVQLSSEEQHYLRRVLRLRLGDQVALVDGVGQMRIAELQSQGMLRRDQRPAVIEARPWPRLGLALALVRRGFEDGLRMACELGVDVFQPLRCDRCVPQAEHRPERWQTVLNEAVEQCERLWTPKLEATASLHGWLASVDAPLAVGKTRQQQTQPLHQWLDRLSITESSAMLWLVIGPEGGWTNAEDNLLRDAGATDIDLGRTILRSATAAVAGSAELVRWRDAYEYLFRT